MMKMIIKNIPAPSPSNILQSNAIISITSITMGQILSNVPFVALYHYGMAGKGITGADVSAWMMLAAASTISGNLTILAAASNIIIIQASESKGIKAFTFFEFLKIGAIVTLINLAVYYMGIAPDDQTAVVTTNIAAKNTSTGKLTFCNISRLSLLKE